MMKKSRSNSKIIYTIISILLSAIFIFQVPIQEPKYKIAQKPIKSRRNGHPLSGN